MYDGTAVIMQHDAGKKATKTATTIAGAHVDGNDNHGDDKISSSASQLQRHSKIVSQVTDLDREI